MHWAGSDQLDENSNEAENRIILYVGGKRCKRFYKTTSVFKIKSWKIRHMIPLSLVEEKD